MEDDGQTNVEPQCADAGAPIAPRTPEVQRALDQCWRAIDALGGTFNPNDPEAQAYDDGLRDALAEIEKLGGRWS